MGKYVVENKKGGALIFTIRQEQPSDYEEVYTMVKKSFATASYSDGTEADYLNEVRTKSTFVPALSCVAEAKNGKIIGQVVLYKTVIETEAREAETLVLSPLSVHPDYFRQGVARGLVRHALAQAVLLGYSSVFLCGEPEIYQKFGFKPSFEFSVYHKSDPEALWCMGQELLKDSLKNISGSIDIV